MDGVRVRYVAQLKLAAGCGEEVVPLDRAANLHDLLRTLADGHDQRVRDFLVATDGTPRPSLLIAIGDQQVVRGDNRALRAGDVVTLMAPMSGG